MLDEMLDNLTSLSNRDLGTLRRYVCDEYERRIRFFNGLTDEERAMPSKIDRVKAVRERTGLGLADAKELVERWERIG